jgi:Uma2 family endonuclease
MAVAGVFTPTERLELLDGEIVEMSPTGRRHVACVDRLAEQLFRAVQGQAIVRVQSPTPLGEHATPQPDVAILRRRSDFFAEAPSTAADLLLVIEVVDTSLEYDRAKWPLYARAGVPEAWLVDLNREVLEVHRDPVGDGYRSVELLHRGESVSLLAYPAASIAVEDILG